MKRQNNTEDYIKVFFTFVPTAIINAKMILDKEGIEYFTRNEDFAALYPGADGMATVEFWVSRNDEKSAKEALRDLIEGSQ